TIANLATIDSATSLLVLRPLAGLDKVDIINTARKIETFDISIEQAPDSCTVFAPNSPATRSTVEQLEREEAKLSVDDLLADIIEATFNSHGAQQE
ncbi:MAG: hypothetical protein KAG97_13710, partial [Victivallales bacterium]|nr:hypothetical protein [Victivallales bacterium]